MPTFRTNIEMDFYSPDDEIDPDDLHDKLRPVLENLDKQDEEARDAELEELFDSYPDLCVETVHLIEVVRLDD